MGNADLNGVKFLLLRCKEKYYEKKKKKPTILLLSVLIYFTYHLEQKAAELSYMHFFQINSLKKE